MHAAVNLRLVCYLSLWIIVVAGAVCAFLSPLFVGESAAQQPSATTMTKLDDGGNTNDQAEIQSLNVQKNDASSSLTSSASITTSNSIRVAHIGNSIQYFNDCPRLLEHMLQTRFSTVRQDSCLRGGATLVSILQKGNGMAHKFSSHPEVSQLPDGGGYDIGAPTVESLLLDDNKSEGLGWDFVILNDHTQSPARPEKKQATMEALKTTYVPLLRQISPVPTVVFLQTAAYKSSVKDSADLGNFDNFTKLLRQGYEEYTHLLTTDVDPPVPAKIAPVGTAYQRIRQQHGHDLWSKLYARDDFHPGPLGTYLEACVLYCTLVGEEPPAEYNVHWWDTARYMQPPNEGEPLQLPTLEEAKLLRDAAIFVCGIGSGQ